MSEVRYAVGNMTGAQVRAVDVYVDLSLIHIYLAYPAWTPRLCS